MWNTKRIALLERDLEAAYDRIKELNLELVQLSAARDDGTAVIEAVMQRGIEWYDVGSQDFQTQFAYFNDAQAMLKNPAFINECNHLRADWARFAVAEAKDFDAVHAVRMSVSALELLTERLQSIPDPRRNEVSEDPHALI